jgi:hypothetical protein
MKKFFVVGGAVLLVCAIAAAIVPMWVATASIPFSAAGFRAVVFMIIGCFAVGGGLMFLIFFSARRGYDDDAYLGALNEDTPKRDAAENRGPGQRR